jgi:hypothetical protein
MRNRVAPRVGDAHLGPTVELGYLPGCGPQEHETDQNSDQEPTCRYSCQYHAIGESMIRSELDTGCELLAGDERISLRQCGSSGLLESAMCRGNNLSEMTYVLERWRNKAHCDGPQIQPSVEIFATSEFMQWHSFALGVHEMDKSVHFPVSCQPTLSQTVLRWAGSSRLIGKSGGCGA